MEKVHRFGKIIFQERKQILRFLVAGSGATGVSIGLLFVLTHYLGLWYIFSALLSYSVSFSISFIAQKFWTFEDSSLDTIQKQGSVYLCVFVFSNVLNSALLYISVDFFGIHYVLGQIISSATIACVNFFVYKYLIFSVSKEIL